VITSEAKAIRELRAKGIKDIARRESDGSRITFACLATFIAALALSRIYAPR
jgi:hypothetical protein